MYLQGNKRFTSLNHLLNIHPIAPFIIIFIAFLEIVTIKFIFRLITLINNMQHSYLVYLRNRFSIINLIVMYLHILIITW